MNKYDNMEIMQLIDVINNGKLGTAKCSGKKTLEFENLFKEFSKSKYALAVSSATAGLHMALLAAGVGPSDEVIVDPLFKFGAVTTIHAGAIPIFPDIDEVTLMPSLENLKQCLSPKTKAVIFTNIFGCCGDLFQIKSWCDENNLILIEDCAQSIFSTCNYKMAGTIGSIGVFSFQETKHLSVGDGGMIVTDDYVLYNNLIALREHGYKKEAYTDIYKSTCSVGWMYRITELQSAVGIAQLEKLKSTVLFHNEIGRMLTEYSNSSFLVPQKNVYGNHVYWKWVALCNNDKLWTILHQKFNSNNLVEFKFNRGKTSYQSDSLRETLKNCYSKANLATPFCPIAEDVVERMFLIKIKKNICYDEYKHLGQTLYECICLV